MSAAQSALHKAGAQQVEAGLPTATRAGRPSPLKQQLTTVAMVCFRQDDSFAWNGPVGQIVQRCLSRLASAARLTMASFVPEVTYAENLFS